MLQVSLCFATQLKPLCNTTQTVTSESPSLLKRVPAGCRGGF